MSQRLNDSRTNEEQFADFLGKKGIVTVSGIHFSSTITALDITYIQPVAIETLKVPFSSKHKQLSSCNCMVFFSS